MPKLKKKKNHLHSNLRVPEVLDVFRNSDKFHCALQSVTIDVRLCRRTPINVYKFQHKLDIRCIVRTTYSHKFLFVVVQYITDHYLYCTFYVPMGGATEGCGDNVPPLLGPAGVQGGQSNENDLCFYSSFYAVLYK